MAETVVVLSTADYDAAVWTNKQHLAARLSRQLNVTYIESLGLRQPKFTLADAKRIRDRLLSRSTPKINVGARATLRVVKPHVLPFHRYKFVQAVNAAMLRRQLRSLVGETNSPSVLWTFSPVTYGVERYFSKVVYHSVDLLHTLPHVPVSLMLRNERELLERADVIIASSSGVRRHLQSLTDRNITLWENVADTDLYASVTHADRQTGAVFAGNLTDSKVDFSILRELAATGTRIVLAGPSAIDGTRAVEEMKRLTDHPNVTYAGNLSPNNLAKLLNSCTVGIIPYHVNEYTRGVFPMKVYEYLASGLAVVSTPLPSLDNVNDHDIHTVPPSRFVQSVLHALESDVKTIESRRVRASSHLWENRANSAISVIKDNL